jgi:putative ABC transport system permease protein
MHSAAFFLNIDCKLQISPFNSGGNQMEPFWQDLRYAARTILKRPLFTLLVVVTLALGIGANTAIFSVVNAVALKPLPFKEPDRLLSLGETNSGWSTTLASSHAFVSWRERSAAFESLAATVWWDANLESGLEPQHISLISVTGDYFSVMSVEPILGRNFLPEETAAVKTDPMVSLRRE